MFMHADARAEIHPAARQVVEHGHFLGQTQRVVEGQLPRHGAEAQGTGGSRHGGQKNRGGSDAPHRGVLMLNGEVRVPAQLF